MSAPERLGDDAARRLVEAAAWRVRLTEEGVESSVAFEEWLGDPANAAAWADVDGPWRRVGEEAASPEMLAARAGALQRAGRRGRGPMAKLVARIAAVLGAAAVVAAVIAGLVHHANAPDVYRTALGERRVLELADGSRVSLDSGTELVVRLARDERRFELRSGQARFDVAHDASRPFRVRAGEQTIVATGTAFTVDLLGSSVMVTLIEGSVTVTEASSAADAPDAAESGLVLSPGEQLRVTESAPPERASVSVTRATAWESGQIIFEDEPLTEAAERVSRYARRQVRAEGAAGELKISGVFRTGDVGTFVEAVTAYLPVVAQPDAAGTTVLRAAP